MPGTATMDYQVKIDELVADNDTLLESAEKSDTGIMPDEDVEKFDANKESIDKLVAQAKRKESHNGLSKVEPSQVPAQAAVVTDRADKPDCGFKAPRDFLLSVIKAGQSQYQNIDDRLNSLRIDAAVGSDENQTQNNPFGGFLVPEAFRPELLMVPSEEDPTVGRTTDIPMESPVVKIPARVDKDHSTSVSGGLTVTRKAEATVGSSSRMEIEQIELNAKTLFGLSFATEELLMDSPQSFAAILEQGFSDEFKAKMLDEKINGTGTGEFVGVLNAPATVVQAKESGQAANTVVFENVINMRSRNWGFGNSVWLAAHDTMPQLAAMNDGTNHIYLPSVRDDVPETLLGRPIFYSEFVPKLGTKGDIILGNWSQYLMGMLQGAQSAESVHVRFDSHERAFKFWMRNDGQPWWRTALTPKNAGPTLSPFVSLAVRA